MRSGRRAARPTAARYVWRGHASRQFVAAILVVHAAALFWLCGNWTRARLIAYDFQNVPSEASIDLTPSDLAALGYREDDVAALESYRTIAAPLVTDTASDAERMRRLGDYIYGLRRVGEPAIEDGSLQQGLAAVFARMKAGQAADCGQMSALLAVLWRSLGGDSRGVRWATVGGDIGHYAVELYSTAGARWMYYDMNLNGYGVGEDGTPLSISTLRAHLLTGQDIHLVANAERHDWTPAEFEALLHDYPIEWYVLNNDLLRMEPGQRFGRLNRFYPTLIRLPHPLQRLADNLSGGRDRRLIVRGKVQVAGLLSPRGARLLAGYLLAIVFVCGVTLLRSRRGRV